MQIQTATLHPAVALLLAYLAGSIPSAYIAGKVRGIDLRQHGSGNLGATNVVRVLGAKVGIVVFITDILKGFAPVYLLPRYIATSHTEMMALALGIAAILGHVRPIFLLWRGGGKGVATAAGVFLGLAWLPTLIVCAIWLAVFLIWWYVSLASLVAAAALPIAIVLAGASVRGPVFLTALSTTIFVFFTHRANIGRLRRGEEHNFRRSKTRER